MSMRKTVCQLLLDNPQGLTSGQVRDHLNWERQQASNCCYQLEKLGVIDKVDNGDHPIFWKPNDKTREAMEKMSNYPGGPRGARKPQGQPLEVVEPAPAAIPNLSVTAEEFANQVANLLHENSELRNALYEMRTRINQLLGDDNGTTSDSGSDQGGTSGEDTGVRELQTGT